MRCTLLWTWATAGLLLSQALPASSRECRTPGCRAAEQETSLLQRHTRTSTDLASQGVSVAPPSKAYACQSDTLLGSVVSPSRKGLAVDDFTLRWCAAEVPVTWPNADTEVKSLRVFQAWNPDWQKDDRHEAWRALQLFASRSQAKVLVGTPISCSSDYDDMLWAWTKEFVQLLGPDLVMGLTIGNELEILQYKMEWKECLERIWEDGYFWRRFVRYVEEFDEMGFGSVPVTSAFTGMALSGEPFYEIPKKGRVKSFLLNATQQYGPRFVFTFNFYPYFDPNLHLDEGTPDQCMEALQHTSCWGTSCNVPITLRMARDKMRRITGQLNDTLWIGETGWSWPVSDTLRTRMTPCRTWSSKETFQDFYQGFLEWNLDIGGEMPPPDHVFWFATRDAANFGEMERFGLIEACGEPRCKLHSPGYDVAHYQLHRKLGEGYCGDRPLFDAFAHDARDCQNRCSKDPRCKFYNIWESHWCRLTQACRFIRRDTDHLITIFKKLPPTTAPRPTTTTTTTTTVTTTLVSVTATPSRVQTREAVFFPADWGEDRACRGANTSDNRPSYYTIHTDVSSLDKCKQLCRESPVCQGLEFHKGRKRCEVWTRAAGVGATTQVTGYTCLRAVTSTSGAFFPVDGGSNRVCRGSTSRDNDSSYYSVVQGWNSLQKCGRVCEGTPACIGIEWHPQGRCEVWTRQAGISASVAFEGAVCLGYNR